MSSLPRYFAPLLAWAACGKIGFDSVGDSGGVGGGRDGDISGSDGGDGDAKSAIQTICAQMGARADAIYCDNFERTDLISPIDPMWQSPICFEGASIGVGSDHKLHIAYPEASGTDSPNCRVDALPLANTSQLQIDFDIEFVSQSDVEPNIIGLAHGEALPGSGSSFATYDDMQLFLIHDFYGAADDVFYEPDTSQKYFTYGTGSATPEWLNVGVQCHITFAFDSVNVTTRATSQCGDLDSNLIVENQSPPNGFENRLTPGVGYFALGSSGAGEYIIDNVVIGPPMLPP